MTAVADAPAGTGWRRSVGYALVLAAAVFLAWSAWSLVQAGRSEQPGEGFSSTRDQVLRTGVQQIVVLNSMDSRRVDASLARWMEVTTGPLRETLTRDRAEAKARFQKARTTARAEVTSAAITSLDTKTGTATVIASLRIRVGTGAATGQKTEQRKRYQFAMERDPSGAWRIKSLTAIPATGT